MGDDLRVSYVERGRSTLTPLPEPFPRQPRQRGLTRRVVVVTGVVVAVFGGLVMQDSERPTEIDQRYLPEVPETAPPVDLGELRSALATLRDLGLTDILHCTVDHSGVRGYATKRRSLSESTSFEKPAGERLRTTRLELPYDSEYPADGPRVSVDTFEVMLEAALGFGKEHRVGDPSLLHLMARSPDGPELLAGYVDDERWVGQVIVNARGRLVWFGPADLLA